MSRTLALLGAMVALTTPAQSGAQPSGRVADASCAPRGVRLVAADSQAEVYVAREPFRAGEGRRRQLGTLTSYRGCANGAKGSFRLGTVGVGNARGGVSTEKVTLAGATVAYATASVVEESEAAFRVVVRDLRTGHTIANVPTGAPLESRPHYVGVGPVRQLVLNDEGAAAWIATDDQRSDSATRQAGREVEIYDVYALDRGGEHLEASGLDVDPHSLALAGSTVYWMQGGKPSSAVL